MKSIPYGNKLFAQKGEKYILSWSIITAAAGIALYFMLPQEPNPRLSLIYALSVAILTLSAYRTWKRGHVPVMRIGIVLVTGGFLYAQAYSLIHDRPVFKTPFGSTDMQGWIVDMHKRANAGGELTLHLNAILSDTSPYFEIGDAVRIFFREDIIQDMKRQGVTIGDFVELSARFFPHRRPTIAGGYDPRLRAWFSNIRAFAFAERVTPIPTASPKPLYTQLIAANNRWRSHINMRIQERLGDEKSGVVIALITGYRGGIADHIRDNLRISGLAHLLAISGLHMVLFAGGVFFFIRAFLALFPTLAELHNIKKWSAGGAIVAACGYFFISGFSVATQRAFIMIMIIFTAVILDRPALTLRNVTLAALVILIITPYHIMSANFHLSFMAVIALVAYYEWLQDTKRLQFNAYITDRRGQILRRQATGFLKKQTANLAAISMTTIIAGTATAPLIAFYFHYFSTYGLLSNLLAMPVMVLAVMPMAPILLLLIPFDMHDIPLYIMAWGVDYIIEIAQWVSALPGSAVHIAAHSQWATISICFGILWLCFWQGRIRIAGAGLCIIGVLLIWILPADKPILIIDGYEKQVALRQENGQLAFLDPSRGAFHAQQWLRIDGDGRSFADAVRNHNKHSHSGFSCADSVCGGIGKGDVRVRIIMQKNAMPDNHRNPVCPDITVAFFNLSKSLKQKIAAQCDTIPIDARDLRRFGTHSVFADGEKIYLKTVRSEQKKRLWTKR